MPDKLTPEAFRRLLAQTVTDDKIMDANQKDSASAFAWRRGERLYLDPAATMAATGSTITTTQAAAFISEWPGTITNPGHRSHVVKIAGRNRRVWDVAATALEVAQPKPSSRAFYNPPLVTRRYFYPDESDNRMYWDRDKAAGVILPGRWWNATGPRRSFLDPPYYQIRASWTSTASRWVLAVPELDVAVERRSITIDRPGWYETVVWPVERAITARHPKLEKVRGFELVCDQVGPIPHLDAQLRLIPRDRKHRYPLLRELAYQLIDAGLSQTQIAAIIDVSQPTIAAWQRKRW